MCLCVINLLYFGIKIYVLFVFLFLFRRVLLDVSAGGTAQVNVLVLAVAM